MAKPLSGSRREYSRAREESTSASGPEPMPPNQALRMTAREKSGMTTAAGCRSSVTSTAENTNKMDSPSFSAQTVFAPQKRQALSSLGSA
jgi:hypothetical protein